MDPIYVPAIGLALFLALGLLSAILASPKAKGRRGEARVHRALTGALPGETHRILHDVTLPTPRGTTQIDHIVLSPRGIFVIETKNMTGWIFGDAGQGQWTQVIHRKKSRLQNPLRQNFKHVKAVEALLGVDIAHIHNLVVFVGDAVAKTEMPECVLWGRRALTQHILSHQETVFSAAQLAGFATRLADMRLEQGGKTDRAHVAALRDRHDPSRGTHSHCPKCEGEMVMRKARTSGEAFLGCARFPACRGMRSVAPVPE